MDNARLAEAFRIQANHCTAMGSPLTATLLDCAAEDLDRGGVLAEQFHAWTLDPVAHAAALRFAGFVHFLAARGDDADLSRCYTQDSRCDRQSLWAGAVRAIERHPALLQSYLASDPQTNEVRRSAVLLGGFLSVARRDGLPLRLLEIGASAGLNLLWDQYRYELGTTTWGKPEATVLIPSALRGGRPDLDQAAEVVSRAGCDLQPLDLRIPEARQRARSYIWADQRDRLTRFDAAADVAVRAGVRVEQADAADWVGRQISKVTEGTTTVIFHSIVWQYLPPETQTRLKTLIQEAGRSASSTAPLAWLRFEPADQGFSLTLSHWPHNKEHILAHAHAHGQWLHWQPHAAAEQSEAAGI